MKILLIGKSGQLGSQLCPVLEKQGYIVVAPDRSELDLAHLPAALEVLKRNAPDLVINTAAFHNVTLCETEGKQAFDINALAVKALAETCADIGSRFLTFSTDYVFDGEKRSPYEESDLARPLQVYGASKLAGECLALAAHSTGTYVVRTCGVYGARISRQKGGNFIEQRIAEGANAASIEIGADQTVSPTCVLDLSDALADLISLGDRWPPGIYHLVNESQCTWHELTQEAFRLLNLQTKVIPVDRGGRTGRMRRPLFSALTNTRASKLGIRLPHWKQGLARYLSETRGNLGGI